MKDYMKIYEEWLSNPYFDEKTKDCLLYTSSANVFFIINIK